MAAGALEQYGVGRRISTASSSIARSIAGTRMALFFRDLGYGKVKVSFRRTGDVDVNAFARQFGGGGHAKASGALVAGGLDDVRERVVTAAREFLDRRPQARRCTLSGLPAPRSPSPMAQNAQGTYRGGPRHGAPSAHRHSCSEMVLRDVATTLDGKVRLTLLFEPGDDPRWRASPADVRER